MFLINAFRRGVCVTLDGLGKLQLWFVEASSEWLIKKLDMLAACPTWAKWVGQAHLAGWHSCSAVFGSKQAVQLQLFCWKPAQLQEEKPERERAARCFFFLVSSLISSVQKSGFHLGSKGSAGVMVFWCWWGQVQISFPLWPSAWFADGLWHTSKAQGLFLALGFRFHYQDPKCFHDHCSTRPSDRAEYDIEEKASLGLMWWIRGLISSTYKPWDPIWIPFHVLSAPFSVLVAWESSMRWHKTLGCFTLVWDLEKVPGLTASDWLDSSCCSH